MVKNLLYLIIPVLIFSCSDKKKNESNPKLAQRLYEEGVYLISERIAIQHIDSLKGIELNQKALEKFDSSYHADTTNAKVLLFASECTIYGKDFQRCIYWTEKLIQIDTLQSDIGSYYERIGDCYVNLGQIEKSKPYFEKALTARKRNSLTN